MVPAKHVFVSYARLDGLGLATQIQDELTNAGMPTWRDQRDIDPYQDFSAEIERAIEQSAHVVVCVTASIATQKDSFVRREITYAQGCGIPISPVVAPNFPVGRIPVLINHLTWLPFWRPERPGHLDFSYGFGLLLDRLRKETAMPGRVAPHDPFRPYLEELYRQIVAYLRATVFSLVNLSARSSSNAVRAPGVWAKGTTQTLPMSFFSAALPVRDTARLTPEPERHFRNIFEAFEHARAQLLLLGDPGAGKTTTLMAFAREAVVERLENRDAPLPVVGRIAQWAERGTPSLVNWLAAGAYPTADAEREILAGRALLLLDGLDELAPNLKATASAESLRQDAPSKSIRSLRTEFMEALETCLDGNQVLMSCRARDFDEIGRPIALRDAVTLKALDDSQLRTYLADQPALAAAIAQDQELREMVRTPLLLSLLTFAFGDHSKPLVDLQGSSRSSGALREHIFRRYIERRFEHEALRAGAAHEFSLEQTYDVLAEAAIASVDYRGGINDFTGTPIERTLDSLLGDRADRFIDQAERLHLLIRPGPGSLRFIHLLVRDHFGLSRAEQFLHDPRRNPSQLLAFLGATHDPRAADLMFSLQRADGSIPIDVVFNIPLDDHRSVLALAHMLSSTARYSHDDYVSEDARWQISRLTDIESSAQRILVSAISHAAGREKADYLIALVFVGEGQRHRRVFEDALADPVAEVRCTAAWALGEGAGNAESIPFLTKLLNDTERSERPSHSQGPQHATVRDAAQEAIRKLSPRR